MNVAGNAGMNEKTNVLSLFGSVQADMPDPLQELLKEAELEAWDADEAPVVKASGLVVTESQFPDQSIYVLEKQLKQLNDSLGRLKFYLGDLDDLLPQR